MDKALKFVHQETREVFYFQRIATRLESITRKRIVVACGMAGKGPELTKREMKADILFGENSLWEYAGGKVWEG